MSFKKNTYSEILKALERLEVLLRSGGLHDDELGRLKATIQTVEALEAARRDGTLGNIDKDQTLWSLVEGAEFADIFHGFKDFNPKLLANKFKLILKGPVHPNEETDATNLARNTTFELNLAARLRGNGLHVSLPHNPDIVCELEQFSLFFQCKRPFNTKNLQTNILRAAKQLSRDLDSAEGKIEARGVVAISVSRAVNPGKSLYRGASPEVISDGLMAEIQELVGVLPWKLIKDPRIIATVFHLFTPAVVKEFDNLIGTAQQQVVFEKADISERELRMLKRMLDP